MFERGHAQWVVRGQRPTRPSVTRVHTPRPSLRSLYAIHYRLVLYKSSRRSLYH
jgi:hypothetical protein